MLHGFRVFQATGRTKVKLCPHFSSISVYFQSGVSQVISVPMMAGFITIRNVALEQEMNV